VSHISSIPTLVAADVGYLERYFRSLLEWFDLLDFDSFVVTTFHLAFIAFC
jgi:hypothetical protein